MAKYDPRDGLNGFMKARQIEFTYDEYETLKHGFKFWNQTFSDLFQSYVRQNVGNNSIRILMPNPHDVLEVFQSHGICTPKSTVDRCFLTDLGKDLAYFMRYK